MMIAMPTEEYSMLPPAETRAQFQQPADEYTEDDGAHLKFRDAFRVTERIHLEQELEDDHNLVDEYTSSQQRNREAARLTHHEARRIQSDESRELDRALRGVVPNPYSQYPTPGIAQGGGIAPVAYDKRATIAGGGGGGDGSGPSSSDHSSKHSGRNTPRRAPSPPGGNGDNQGCRVRPHVRPHVRS